MMRRLAILGLLVAALACNLPSARFTSTPFETSSTPPETTSTPILLTPTLFETPSTPPEIASTLTLFTPTPSFACSLAPTVPSTTATFAISILIDLNSEPVPMDKLETALDEADTVLSALTGFTFSILEINEVHAESTISDLAYDYVESAASLPNGLVIFSFGDGDRARTYGGYSLWVAGPSGYRNSFVSPLAGDRHVYVAVLHWGHRYGRCGYGDSQTPISTVSVDGECRNQPGIDCVQHNGYSMCPLAVNDLYASTPTYFVAANIVHEFMHPFGTNGVYDHYGTAECRQAMGWTNGEWFFSLDNAEQCAGMCPNVFEAFRASFQPFMP